MNAILIRRHVSIEGRVQGVGFRASCRYRAQALNLSGWVANAYDGSVEAVFEGERSAVEEIVAWCRVGPPRALVTAVRVRDEDPTGETRFVMH